MIARFRSTCPMCGNYIHPGDTIVQRDSSMWQHNVCPDTEHIVQPEQVAAARAYGIDSTFVAFVARLILEQGSEDAAWAEFCDLNEHWDGEPDYRAAALSRWQATLPFAHAQNALIHPNTQGAAQ